MSCGIGRRHGSDLALLWLWHRPAATILIRPLAWELPCATGAALKKIKKGHNELCRTDTDSRTLKNLWFPSETGGGGECTEGLGWTCYKIWL